MPVELHAAVLGPLTLLKLMPTRLLVRTPLMALVAEVDEEVLVVLVVVLLVAVEAAPLLSDATRFLDPQLLSYCL